MIPARKNRWFNAWFAAHARSRIHGRFGAVLVSGAEDTRLLAADAPLLLVANHSAWWDPLVILHASQHLLGVDAYALMAAENLRNLPYFALVGAFGVELGQPADGLAAIRYASRLLDRAGRAVWIFPQGRERPSDERPLGFRAGAAQIARVARRARVVPVALRYEFAREERPRLYLAFGAPLASERDIEASRAAQERAVTAELGRIHRALGAPAELAAFTPIYQAQRSRFGQLAEGLLAHWTRPRAPLTPELPEAGHGDRS